MLHILHEVRVLNLSNPCIMQTFKQSSQVANWPILFYTFAEISNWGIFSEHGPMRTGEENLTVSAMGPAGIFVSVPHCRLHLLYAGRHLHCSSSGLGTKFSGNAQILAVECPSLSLCHVQEVLGEKTLLSKLLGSWCLSVLTIWAEAISLKTPSG